MARSAKPAEPGRLGWLDPGPRQEAHQTTYWKHWSALLRAAFLPFALFVALALFGQAMSWLFSWLWLLLLLLPLLWIGWCYLDWRNDFYVVSADRIQTVDQLPFGWRQRRKETSFAQIRQVSLRAPSLLAIWLDYGDVYVDSANAGRLTLWAIPQPNALVNDLKRRLEQARAGAPARPLSPLSPKGEGGRRGEVRPSPAPAATQAPAPPWPAAPAPAPLAPPPAQAPLAPPNDSTPTYPSLTPAPLPGAAGQVLIVRSPHATQVGQEVTIEWRVAARRVPIHTCIWWDVVERPVEQLTHRTALQRGGAGNYAASLVVPLAETVYFSVYVDVAGQTSWTPIEALYVPDVAIRAPVSAEPGRVATVRWRAPGLEGPAELCWATASQAQDEYPERVQAIYDDGWYAALFLVPPRPRLYCRIRAQTARGPVYSREFVITSTEQ